ncbi:hypothetical protein F5Y19DRAFT_37244 [Xylariaceae sp. FL1651]|nr:hypothetical protein F5Y19DRAFT_37244 [Xylariaceae sp. FL1651]
MQTLLSGACGSNLFLLRTHSVSYPAWRCFLCSYHSAYHLKSFLSTMGESASGRRDGMAEPDEATQVYCKSILALHLTDGLSKDPEKRGWGRATSETHLIFLHLRRSSPRDAQAQLFGHGLRSAYVGLLHDKLACVFLVTSPTGERHSWEPTWHWHPRSI